MEITLGSGHLGIIHDYAEKLVSNWLNRSGFTVECEEHDGISIVAYNNTVKKRLGILLISRTRKKGVETDPVRIFFNAKGERQNFINACHALAYEPWLGVYIETTDYADLFLTSLTNYTQKYTEKGDRVTEDWKMKPVNLNIYKKDN